MEHLVAFKPCAGIFVSSIIGSTRTCVPKIKEHLQITLINYTENNYKTKLLNMQDKFDPKQASSRVYIK